MAKYSRLTVGSVYKAKDKTKSDYIKLRGDMKNQLLEALGKMDEKEGMYLTLESAAQQMASLDAAQESNKISAENAAKARERIEAIPEYVRFSVVLVQKND